MARRDPVSDVTQKPHATSLGTCDLPAVYRDGGQLGLMYRSDLDRARALLEGTTLEPWPMLGAAMTTLQAWTYRDSSIGAYDEVGLGIFARKKGSRPSLLRFGLDMRAQEDQGIWVVTLPVTTEAAFVAGVELWGYPKYVSPITSDFGEREARVRLGDELEITVESGLKARIPSVPIVTFTNRGGRLIRTVIDTHMHLGVTRGRTGSVKILGKGRTSDAFVALGLEGAEPMLAFRTDAFRAVLPEGKDVGPAV